MEIKEIPTPTLPEWVKLYNTYDPEHYTPGKRVSAEEWNTLFLASVRQGNYNADTLELLLNTYLPTHFSDYDVRLTETTRVAQDAHATSASAYSFSEEANAFSKTAFDHSEEALSTARTAEANSSAALQTAEGTLSTAQAAQTASEYAVTQSDTAAQNAATALQDATTALSNSETALSKSTSALQLSEHADSNASTALTQSTTALSNSEIAISDSSTALGEASTALSSSTQAANTANTSLLRSEDAIATANAAKIESASAKSVADTAAANSNTALSTSQEAKDIADTAEQIAQNALDLVTEGVGSQVLVDGKTVSIFNADTKADITYVNQKIDDIMGPGSTEAIDTILELANAFKNNSDIIKTLNEAISTKANTSDVTDLLATKANTSALANYLSLKTGGQVNGVVNASTLVSRGDVQAQYLQAAAAGHETGTYDKIATLSSTGYIRYRTKAEMKSDLGVPTSDDLSAVTDATLSDDSKTLTISKRDGTSFDFQGGGGGSAYPEQINVTASGAVTQTLQPNYYYNFTGALSSLVLKLAQPTPGIRNVYTGVFYTGSTSDLPLRFEAYSGLIKYGWCKPSALDRATYYMFHIENNLVTLTPVYNSFLLSRTLYINDKQTTIYSASVNDTVLVAKTSDGVLATSTIEGDQQYKISVALDPYMSVQSLTCNDTAISNNSTITCKGDTEIVARVVGQTTTVTWNTVSNATISVKLGDVELSRGASVRVGDTLTVTATAASGYSVSITTTGFAEGSYKIIGLSPTITFTVA